MSAMRKLPDSHPTGRLRPPSYAIAGLAGTSFKHAHLPAILADPIARDLGVSSNWIARLPWRQDLRTRLILAVYASQLALGRM